MAAADALVASATRVLDSCSDKTATLTNVVQALYEEFGKDECKAIMQDGAKRWFEQYALNFRVDAHGAGGHEWHTVTLISSEWQTVAVTSTAAASSELGHSTNREISAAEADYVGRLVHHLRGKQHDLLPSLGIAVPKPDSVPSSLSKVLQRHPNIFSLHRVGASDAVSLAQGADEAGSHNIATAGPTPEVLCFTYGLHLLFSNSQRGWPSTKEELRSEAAPLCTGMRQKLYQLSSLGGVKVLSGTNLVWCVEKMRLLVLNTPPSIRQEAEILVRCAKMSASTRNGVSSAEAIEHGSVETSNGLPDGAALTMDCGSLHVEATPTALPESDAQPSSQRPSMPPPPPPAAGDPEELADLNRALQQSRAAAVEVAPPVAAPPVAAAASHMPTDPTTRLLEAMVSNVDAEHPDREADIVTRHMALGMLRARTGMIRLETRVEAAEARAELAEARVTTLEAELRKTGQMLSNALEAQAHLEGRLLQMASSSAAPPGEPRSAAEAQVVELAGILDLEGL